MKTFNLAIILVMTLLMVSCKNESNQITNPKDYDSYLVSKDTKSIDFAKNEIDFWQKKFDAAPNQISYLSQIAANYSKLFEITGDRKGVV